MDVDGDALMDSTRAVSLGDHEPHGMQSREASSGHLRQATCVDHTTASSSSSGLMSTPGSSVYTGTLKDYQVGTPGSSQACAARLDCPCMYSSSSLALAMQLGGRADHS